MAIQHHEDDEEERGDPLDVEKLLSEDLLQLSSKDRNYIQEEIHGVRCLAPEETPGLLEESLRRLAIILDSSDTTIPVNKKHAYLESQKLPKTYVNEDDFRLRFLRCELFDVIKAADRIVMYLDLVLGLFGDFALQRAIRLSDFDREELRYFRMGHYQLMPFRDRSGRRILTIFPNKVYEQLPREAKDKIFIYMIWTAGYDVDTQRKGLVFSTWFDSSHTTIAGTNKSHACRKMNPHELLSVRASAIHICSPDTPLFQFRRAVIMIRIARDNRPKLKVHLGESVELCYALQSYGIPTENIPISSTGKIKIGYIKQWMRIRQVIEIPRDNENENENKDDDVSWSSSSSSSSSPNTNTLNIIECPQLNDVIFRQGTSLFAHPGNVAFRSLIETKVKNEGLLLEEVERSTRSIIKIKRRKCVLEIIKEIQLSCGRFLVWNNESCWWNNILDKELIILKIEYLVKEHRNKSMKAKRTAADRHRRHQLNLIKSGTFIFQSQDGGTTSSAFSCNNNKRKRLNNNNKKYINNSSDLRK